MKKILAIMVVFLVVLLYICPAFATAGPEILLEPAEGGANGTAKVKVSIQGIDTGKSVDFAQIFLRIPDNVNYSSVEWNQGVGASLPTDVFSPNAMEINEKSGANRVIPIIFALQMDNYEDINQAHKALTQGGKIEVCTITLSAPALSSFDMVALGFETSKTVTAGGAYVAYFDDAEGTQRPLNQAGDITVTVPVSVSAVKTYNPMVILDYRNADFDLIANDGDFSMNISLSRNGRTVVGQVGRYPSAGYVEGVKRFPVKFMGLEAGTYKVELDGEGYVRYSAEFIVGEGSENITIGHSQFYPGAIKPADDTKSGDVADFHEMVCATKHADKMKYPYANLVDFNRDGAVNDLDLNIFRMYWK